MNIKMAKWKLRLEELKSDCREGKYCSFTVEQYMAKFKIPQREALYDIYTMKAYKEIEKTRNKDRYTVLF